MSARVLVVDDIEVNVKLLEAKLLSEYYDVLTASNGKAALEIARRDTPDIILLDVMMPGMDGLEVCRRLKADARTKYIPVVMVTALSDVADRLRGLDVGADDFLTKPVNDVALFARIRSLIRLKRTMDEWMLREEIHGRLAALPGETLVLSVEAFEPARILLLEDNSLAAGKIAQILAPITQILTTVKTNAEAHAEATAELFDLVIVSMSLDQDDPLRLVSRFRAAGATRQLPILLVAEDGDYPRLAKGLDIGANDYVIRPLDRNELIVRARGQIKRKRLQEELLHNYKRGMALALTDGLTGLYNRRYLSAHLETLLAHATGPLKGVSLIMFDIDHFKQINDTYGHAAGDEVLIEMAKRALGNVRGFDLIARYGGEEFIVVMPESTLANAAVTAERLRRTVTDKPFVVSASQGQIEVTISVGVACCTGDLPKTPAELLKEVDDALYAAKNGGRNIVKVFGEQTTAEAVPTKRDAFVS
jgi:two-component system cell cycle response regulator